MTCVAPILTLVCILKISKINKIAFYSLILCNLHSETPCICSLHTCVHYIPEVLTCFYHIHVFITYMYPSHMFITPVILTYVHPILVFITCTIYLLITYKHRYQSHMFIAYLCSSVTCVHHLHAEKGDCKWPFTSVCYT